MKLLLSVVGCGNPWLAPQMTVVAAVKSKEVVADIELDAVVAQVNGPFAFVYW